MTKKIGIYNLYYVFFNLLRIDESRQLLDHRFIINEQYLILFYGILSEKHYNNLLKVFSSLFRMGNSTSICGQLASHSL